MSLNIFKLLFTSISLLLVFLLCATFDINTTTGLALFAFIISASNLAENIFISLLIRLHGNDIKQIINETWGKRWIYWKV